MWCLCPQGAWTRQVQDTCAQQGFVQTLGGRRRYIRNIFSTDRQARSSAKRQAVNTVCQVWNLKEVFAPGPTHLHGGKALGGADDAACSHML